jgi:hypothetical protein
LPVKLIIITEEAADEQMAEYHENAMKELESPSQFETLGATYGSDTRRLDAPTQISEEERHYRRQRIDFWNMDLAGRIGVKANDEDKGEGPSNTK